MEAWGRTDPGKVRSQNQDYFRIDRFSDGSLLAVVCDGMGGAKAGDIASHLACEVFANDLIEMYDPRLSEDQLAGILDSAVTLANRAVHEQAQSSEDFNGMGTTLVAALVRPNVAYLVNVGDSRGYFIASSYIGPITMDHSVVEMMVQRGEITREEARNYPGKNLITRAIGISESVLCDLYRQPLQEGESILLCSDGLSNVIADQEILFEIEYGGEKASVCERLVDIALERNAPDNVTSVLITV